MPGVEDLAGRVLEREENRRHTRLDEGRLKGSEGPSDAGYVKPVDGPDELHPIC